VGFYPAGALVVDSVNCYGVMVMVLGWLTGVFTP